MCVTIYYQLIIDESRAFLREAMKQGYVNVTLVKVIVEGPAGVGKTSLMYLLLSRSPPDKRNSTGCAERAIQVIRVGKEGGEWNEISTKVFREMIAEAVPILYQELKVKGMGMEELNKVLSGLVEETEEVGSNEGVDGEVKGDGGEGGVTGDEGSEGGMDGDGLGNGEKKFESSNVVEDSQVVIDKVIKELAKLVSGGKSSRRLLDMELIYLTDCGGQQAYILGPSSNIHSRHISYPLCSPAV